MKLIVCFLSLLPYYVLAQSAEFDCTKAGGTDEIAGWIRCQNNASLSACAGLGTAIAGRVAQKALQASYKNIVERVQNQVYYDKAKLLFENQYANRTIGSKEYLQDEIEATKDQITTIEKHLSWSPKSQGLQEDREALKGQLEYYETQLATGHAPYKEYQSAVLKSGKMINVNAYPNFESLPQEAKDIFISNVQSDAPLKWNKTAKIYVLNADEFRDGLNKLKPYEKVIYKVGEKISSKSALVAGGIVGVAVFLASEGADSTSTGCDPPLYVNLDKDNECKPVYEVNKTILDFLDLPEKERMEAFKKDKGLCSYYRQLHVSLFKQPKFTSLTCKKSKIILETDQDGQITNHEMLLYSDGTIRQIKVSTRGIGWRGDLFMDVKGNVQNLSSPSVAKLAIPLKLYVPDAVACCQNKNDSEAFQCMNQFNGQRTAPSAAPPDSPARATQ